MLAAELAAELVCSGCRTHQGGRRSNERNRFLSGHVGGKQDRLGPDAGEIDARAICRTLAAPWRTASRDARSAAAITSAA
jgi:hypothetical protein